MSYQLFVAWVPFQRRSLSMQSYFKYELYFISISFQNKYLRVVEYLYKALKTLLILLFHCPDIFWIQLPPNFILHLAILFKNLLHPKMQIVADCHNATFRSPWVKIPYTISFLNRCDLVIVHNSSVLDQATALGVNKNKLLVLEDPPASIKIPEHIEKTKIIHPLLVCPCSFNADEPIQEIIEAARLIPNIAFYLTGNSNRAKGLHSLTNLPHNVKITGFLTEDEFNLLLFESDLIMGLTKLDGIQLSVANEAVGIGKPLVLANTKTLKAMFYRGAVFVDALEPKSIAQGCQEALMNINNLSQEIDELRVDRKAKWSEQAGKVIKLLAKAS